MICSAASNDIKSVSLSKLHKDRAPSKLMKLSKIHLWLGIGGRKGTQNINCVHTSGPGFPQLAWED